jgi:hypothetical protein
MKFLLPGLLLLSLSGSGLLAQTISGGDSPAVSSSDSSPAPAGERKKSDQAPQGPTIIDSQNMDYDGKTRISIFTGDDYGVYVKDPSFIVYCDKLTAYMRKDAGPTTPGAKPSATPTPTPTPAAKGKGADSTAGKAGGLQRALAEGNSDYPVVIVQDKPGVNGAAPEHNVGIALKADYNADTGDVVLTGWPRVSQGINTQIATSADTVMTMNKDGHTMKTHGPSRTVIQEQDQPKTTGSNSKSADQSPSPSEQ